MAFLLLQTATVANDAYVTLNRGRRFVRALFPFWSPQMKNNQKNVDLSMLNVALSPARCVE